MEKTIVTGEALKEVLQAMKTQFDNVNAKADSAQATANSASTAAQTAQTTATQASQAASTADTKATNAASAAATADGKAVQAQTTANAASTAAQTADTKATQAQTTASTALSNAATAQSTADAKQSKLYLHKIKFNILTISIINTRSTPYTYNELYITENFNSIVNNCVDYSYLNVTGDNFELGTGNLERDAYSSSQSPYIPIFIDIVDKNGSTDNVGQEVSFVEDKVIPL